MKEHGFRTRAMLLCGAAVVFSSACISNTFKAGNGGTPPMPDAPLTKEPLASAQPWKPAGYAAGGLFTSVAIDPVDRAVIYACGDVSGIYRSDDGGDTWQSRSAGLDSRRSRVS